MAGGIAMLKYRFKLKVLAFNNVEGDGGI